MLTKLIRTLFVPLFTFFLGMNGAAAALLTQVTGWGTLNTACTNENDAACIDDSAFTYAGGGTNQGTGAKYWGGQISWGFNFDPTPFSSINAITLEFTIIGFWDGYPGNIDAAQGQTGDYFAIDGNPIHALTGTDGRDDFSFGISPASLSAGAHTFSVVAYTGDWQVSKNEGWAGVDVARLTVNGESQATSTVPSPATLPLMSLGLVALGFSLRRRRTND